MLLEVAKDSLHSTTVPLQGRPKPFASSRLERFGVHVKLCAMTWTVTLVLLKSNAVLINFRR